MPDFDLITILGPTASGKTTLAAQLASNLSAEIISADSRQVYRGMDIGTGKDLSDYIVDNKNIAYHLIDICDAGEKYNLYEYQHDFHRVYTQIKSEHKNVILCGGTGLYIEAVLKGFRLLSVPENAALRNMLAQKTMEELKIILESLTNLHNISDFDSAKRTIRAIEIAEYQKNQPANFQDFKPLNSLIIGLNPDREIRRERITKRLKLRLDEGLIEEVQNLMKQGVSADDLIYYGLEYKFVTQYLVGQIDYKNMFEQLEIAIHQFSKRQMTWFRGMERRGFKIEWLDSEMSDSEKIKRIISLL